MNRKGDTDMNEAISNERRWCNRMRFEWFMDKLAPYIIVVGAMFAFLAIGVMECGL